MTIAPAIKVSARKAIGGVDAAFADDIVAAITTPGGAVLSGTSTRGAVDGSATFDDLSIDLPGTYTLTFSSAGLTSAESVEFDVVVTFALDGLETMPVAAYSFRRLFAVHSGAVIRLRRDSDDAEADFGTTATGDLDEAAIATWLGGASGFLVTMYDQAASGSVTQATTANQPTLQTAPANLDHAACNYDGANDSLGDATSPVSALPITVYLVYQPTVSYGSSDLLWGLGAAANSSYALFATGSGVLLRARNGAAIGDATTTVPTTQDTSHLLEARLVATNQRYVRLDGANEGSNTTSVTLTPAGPHRIGAAADFTAEATGFIPEVLVFGVDLGAAEHLDDRNLIGAASAYWGCSYTPI
ncbi:MAG: arabinofuranosidase catalytic domain-containing protein [Planctomycetota bacterium]